MSHVSLREVVLLKSTAVLYGVLTRLSDKQELNDMTSDVLNLSSLKSNTDASSSCVCDFWACNSFTMTAGRQNEENLLLAVVLGQW